MAPDFKLLAIRAAIKTIGTENIANMVSQLIEEQWKQAQTIELEPGEKEIAAYIYQSNGKTVFATAAVKVNESENIEITRYLNVFSVEELLQNIISKFE